MLGTVGGFGSSVFFVPLARFFFSAQLVLGLTGFFHLFSNLAKLTLFYKYVQLGLTLRFVVPSMIFAIVGAWASARFDSLYGDAVLSVFLVLFSGWLWYSPRWKISQTSMAIISSGGVSGFLAGFTGTGGAVRGLALTAFRLEQSAFVATSAAIDMGVDISRTVIYWQSGFIHFSDWPWLVLLIAVSWIGTWIGKKVLKEIHPDWFYRLVLILIFSVGMISLVRFISQAKGFF